MGNFLRRGQRIEMTDQCTSKHEMFLTLQRMHCYSLDLLTAHKKLSSKFYQVSHRTFWQNLAKI